MMKLLLTTSVLVHSVLAAEHEGHKEDDVMLVNGYHPTGDISVPMAMHADQEELESQLSESSRESFEAAESIYVNGYGSKPKAVVFLDSGLTEDISSGTMLYSEASSQNLTTVGDYKTGDTELTLHYSTNLCKVVAEVSTDCLPAAGSLLVNLSDNNSTETTGNETATASVLSFSYTYDPVLNNTNAVTMQSLSASAGEDFGTSSVFQKFVDYYGHPDYANRWVLGAFEGTAVNFTDDVVVDFALYRSPGVAQAVKKGSAYLLIFMQIIGEMEQAVKNCGDGTSSHWDRAVAYYAGTASETSNGKFIYALAQKRCGNFLTCASSDRMTGTATVNEDIMKLFSQGQSDLMDGKCDAVKASRDKLDQLVVVPLIQGTMRYLYRSYELKAGSNEKIDAEAATFAASVVPFIHACNKDDAATIRSVSKIGYKGEVDIAAVKKSFEKNYDCLGITCEDVGGLYNEESKEYFPGAEPCGTDNEVSAAITPAAFGLSSVFAGLFIITSLL